MPSSLSFIVCVLGLKKRTRKALGLRKKDKDTELPCCHFVQKKTNGAPNGFYGEFDWDRYASPDVDEEGFSQRPGDEASTGKQFFSSSDSEDDEESKKKFQIKIKPLAAESAKCIPPSLDELKASVGGLALSPSLVRKLMNKALFFFLKKIRSFGFLLLFISFYFTFIRSASKKSQLMSIEHKSVPALILRQCSPQTLVCPSGPSSPARSATPQSRGSPVPPPPPPRPSSRPKLPPGKPIPDLVCVVPRGPSPLTMGPQDTLPVAAAFTETVNAYFKGADPSKCVVKITGELVLSFPAGITRHFASHPTQPVLIFSISNYTRLEQVLPNPQLLCCDSPTDSVDTKEFWVNMQNLMSHLKKVAEQKPQATYYNVDMIKYQVSADGIQSTPLNLAVSWRGDAGNTDLRIDYKYNTEAMATPAPLHNLHFLVPVDGGVAKLQAMVPPATWNPEQQMIQWKIPSLSNRSENGGVGALLGRFQMTEGLCKPSQLAVHFTSEGSTMSGCDIQLLGTGYRLSLIKKRFAAGQYELDIRVSFQINLNHSTFPKHAFFFTGKYLADN
uniref:SH3GL interacting endocytic adaptor 1 n=1 Tax=Hippocampus comes TaxID=109280 RepID=A0A3Q2YM19_HIPCM